MLKPGDLVRLKLMEDSIPKALRGQYAEILNVSAGSYTVNVRMGTVRLKLDIPATACKPLEPDAAARLIYLLGHWWEQSAGDGMKWERYRNRLTNITDILRDQGFPNYEDFAVLALSDTAAAWNDAHIRKALRTKAKLERVWEWLMEDCADLAEAAFDYVGL